MVVKQQLFISSWIMLNYNANTLILLPKVPNVDSIELFKLIALANFKLKIISKVIVDRLSPIFLQSFPRIKMSLFKGDPLNIAYGSRLKRST